MDFDYKTLLLYSVHLYLKPYFHSNDHIAESIPMDFSEGEVEDTIFVTKVHHLLAASNSQHVYA